MKQRFTKLLGGALFALFLVPSSAKAEWRDIKVDLTNKKLLSSDEISGMSADPATFAQWSWVNGGDYIGIAVGEGDVVSRVDKDAPNAACKIKGKWHSDNYGWSGLEIVVAVKGPVKITYGLGDFSGDVIVKDATNTEVANMNISGTTWTSSNTDRVKSCYYTGDATTLTITGGSYQTYFAIEETEYVPNNKTLTFDKGDSGAEGVVPTTVVQDIKISDSFTIPTNFTLYKEGYTLTGWNDGSSTYNVGATYTITNDVTFTPVFTANTVSLNDRTAATTIRWDFRKNQGVPLVGWQGNSGFLVGQADINGTKLDVKMNVDATSGKFNNSNGDWAQVNSTTNFTMPICYGAEFSSYTMSTTAKGTFDGVEGGSNDGYNLKYTYTGSGSTMVVGLGAASWYGYIDVTYPAPQTVDVTISSALYATYYNSALALTVPANLQAATVDGESGGVLTLNWRYNEDDVIPAGTPVLLKATAASTYTLTEKIGDATAAPAGNQLYGSDTETTTTGGGDGAKYYALQYGTGENASVLGFYWMAADGAAFTSGAHKAWLALPAATLAPFFTLDGGETTSISEELRMKSEESAAATEWYTLDGRRVQPSNLKKGLYIVNGRKVVIK